MSGRGGSGGFGILGRHCQLNFTSRGGCGWRMWIRYEVESRQLIRTVKQSQSNIRHPLATAVELSFTVALSGDATAALTLNLYRC